MINKVKKHTGFHYLLERNTAVYFDSLGIECIQQEVLKKINDKTINNNLFRIQEKESVMWEFCCMAFIEYMIT